MTINVGKIKVVLKFHLRTPCLNLRLETAIKISQSAFMCFDGSQNKQQLLTDTALTDEITLTQTVCV